MPRKLEIQTVTENRSVSDLLLNSTVSLETAVQVSVPAMRNGGHPGFVTHFIATVPGFAERLVAVAYDNPIIFRRDARQNVLSLQDLLNLPQIRLKCPNFSRPRVAFDPQETLERNRLVLKEFLFVKHELSKNASQEKYTDFEILINIMGQLSASNLIDPSLYPLYNELKRVTDDITDYYLPEIDNDGSRSLNPYESEKIRGLALEVTLIHTAINKLADSHPDPINEPRHQTFIRHVAQIYALMACSKALSEKGNMKDPKIKNEAERIKKDIDQKLANLIADFSEKGLEIKKLFGKRTPATELNAHAHVESPGQIKIEGADLYHNHRD